MMRADILRGMVMVYTFANLLHSSGQEVSSITIGNLMKSVNDRLGRDLKANYMDQDTINLNLKRLTDQGVLEWSGRRAGSAGKLVAIHHEMMPTVLSMSRSAAERDQQKAVAIGLKRWHKGKLVYDAEVIRYYLEIHNEFAPLLGYDVIPLDSFDRLHGLTDDEVSGLQSKNLLEIR